MNVLLYKHITHSSICQLSFEESASMSNFKERLSQLKAEKNVFQKDIAKNIGISLRAFQYYERGEREPNLSVLLSLAEYFDVSLDYLTGRSNNPEPFSYIGIWEKQFVNNLSKIIPNLNYEDVISSNIDVNAWKQIASGAVRPTIDNMCAIANILGISLDKLTETLE